MALGPVSFSGAASGFDIKSIISAILNAERAPVTRLEARQSGIDARKSSYQDLGGKLSTLRSLLQDLAAPATLSARTVTSSESSIVTAVAGTAADLGDHEIEVQTLAKAGRVRSDSVSSRFDPAVSDGTITVRSGSRDLVTIDVSAATGNNSLVSIRDQINAASAGVTASIVNDGTGDLLVLKSSSTGAANELAITDTTNLDLTNPANRLETAANATVLIDGISVTSASNTITSAISGVTLTLVTAEPGTTVNVSVESDKAKVKDSIKDFVDAYNAVADYLKGQFTADAKTGKAGVLAGDALLRRAQEILSSTVSGAVAGLPSTDLTTLGAIGVAIEGSSGRLTIDDTKLDAALSDRFDQISRLFAASGRSTDGAVSFVALSTATKTGTYSVEVTTAPLKATVLGSAAIDAGGIAQDETLTISLGTASAEVSLTQGDTADTIVTKINTALASAGVSARASNEAGSLRLSSDAYGSAITLSVVSSQADAADGLSAGIGTVALTDTGRDIAGRLNGVDATGAGTVLTGALGDDSEGLTVSIIADDTSVAGKGGTFGTIAVSRGVADSLAREIKPIVESGSGLITATVGRIDEERSRISDEIARLEQRLVEREIFLTLQFDAAERAIQALQSQQSALQQAIS